MTLVNDFTNLAIALAQARVIVRAMNFPVTSLETDLLIAGGGMAGVCAALAAARHGARVVLVQDRSVLGGNASSEVKMHIVGADCHGQKPGLRESGLMEELRVEDAVRNPHRCYSQWDLLLYEKVKLEPNITLLLDTDITGVEMDGNRIQTAHAVRISTADTFHIRARFFADCTGDGGLGAAAGADCQIGREGRDQFGESLAQPVGDRQTLGSSILLTARRHDTPQPYMAPSWIRSFTAEDLKLRPIRHYDYGYWWFEWGGQLDTIKDNETIRHELLRITLGIWNYIKNSGEHPDAANWALDWVGAIPGKRESRRFLGPHILTQQDVLGATVFPDTVAYGGWYIDTHPPLGVDAPEEPPCTQHHFPHVYGLPLRCYHSRNIANLFFAGRNISATHIAFASSRVMATCAVGGQAVGTAAALWRRESDNDVAALATPERIHALQQTLLRDDVFLASFRADDPDDLARQATLTASSGNDTAALVVDGITRDLKASFGAWATDSNHAWEAPVLPATLRLELAQPTALREVHLTFDTGFARELVLTPDGAHSRKVVRGPQPETVRHYRIRIDGQIVVEETNNIHRKRVHALPATVPPGSHVELEVLSTHGASVARVFEVRLYA